MSRAMRMLLESGLISRGDFDRASFLQAKYGETIGFHLVGIGVISNEDLLDFLSKRFPLTICPRKLLNDLPKKLTSRFTPELAEELRIVPVAVSEDQLVIGVTDPSRTHALEEAAFHCGCFVAPVLVSESDMTWALNHYYGVKPPVLSEMPEHADCLRRDSQLRRARAKHRARAGRTSIIRVTPQGWKLDDIVGSSPPLSIFESEAFPLVRPASSAPAASPVGRAASAIDPLADLFEKEDTRPYPSVGSDVADSSASISKMPPRSSLEPAAFGAARPRLSSQAESKADFVKTGEPSTNPRWHGLSRNSDRGPTHTAARSGATAVSKASSAPQGDDRWEPRALTEGELLQKIGNAQTRDAMVKLAMEYLLRFAERAAFFVVKKGEIRGFDIAGNMTSRPAIRSFWVPVNTASTLSNATSDQQIHLGPLGRTDADAILAAALGGRPARVLVIPIEIRRRTVGLLYADHLTVDMPPWNRIERLSEIIGESLGRLILGKGEAV